MVEDRDLYAENLQRVYVEGKIILKLTYKKWGRERTGLISLTIGPSKGSSAYDQNKFSSVRGREFLD
jgi:hypothetical protein